MSLVLGLLILGGSSAAVWAGITDPEGGVWAGLRNAVQQTPNAKHVSYTSAAFISGLAGAVNGTAAPDTGGHGGAAPSAYVAPSSAPAPPAGANHYNAITGTWGSGAPASGARSAIIATAHGWIGTPYRWGGTTRTGVDCSGFVQNVYAAHGIAMPRVAAAQAAKGRSVPASHAQPADLVFFGAPAHHVGIVLGDGTMIHAPKPGGRVRVERIAGAVTGSPAYYRNVVGG